MKIRDIGEIGFINRLARRARLDKSVVCGIGDDAAVIKWTKGKYLLYTCDMLVENVHFKTKRATPHQIGWKALGRAISDVAAMGGVPRYALVSIGIDPKATISFTDALYGGIADLAKRFEINIVGGDTSRSDALVIDVSLIGEVERENLVLRGGARPGDSIFVTGSLGGSMKSKHLDFMPRINEARLLVKSFKINSMIDISDGLLLDLRRILDASKAGGRIYENLIPLSKGAGSFREAISGGEDYELLFTMNRKEARRLLKTGSIGTKTPITLIGEVAARGLGYRLVGKDGAEEAFGPRGYLHF